MRLIDISMPIRRSMVQWPGDPRVRIRHPLHLAKGDPVTLTALALCAHSGTHVDAPSHFIMGGTDLDSIPLDVLVGRAVVVDARGHGCLDAAVMDAIGIPQGVPRVLFRTDNSERGLLRDVVLHEDYAAVSAEGARWLVSRGVRLVGIDYLSIGPFPGGAETHTILLGAGAVVVEGLSLEHVTPGSYDLVCLPLRLVGTEGAPARAILIDGGSEEPARRTGCLDRE
jgi:arylformamidase